MKEVEILITFDDSKEEVLEKLLAFEYVDEKEIYDTYYVDQLRDNLKPEANLRTNELFRIRRKGEECYVTYKKNHFEGNRWTYSDEYEIKADNYKTMEKIVEMLGLEVQVTVHNRRKFFHYNDYEIIFEDVEDLGLFIEVEKMIADEIKDVMKVKSDIREFINSLGLKNVRELDLGKNQLALRNKLNRNDIDIYITE